MFRIYTGIGVFLFGLWLFIVGLLEGGAAAIPGIVIIIISIAILLNKHEDEIEEIKNNKK